MDQLIGKEKYIAMSRIRTTVALKEEDRKTFTFPVDGITLEGRPLREFLADKDVDTITFTAVAGCYVEPEPIEHIVIVPDSTWFDYKLGQR